MATRRDMLRWATVVPAAGLLGACTPRGADTPGPVSAPPAGSLLQVDTSTGPAVIDIRDGRLLVGPFTGVAAWDGTALAGGELASGGGPGRTRVALLGGDGDQRFAVTLDGALTPRVVSPSRDLVALTLADKAGATPYRPEGRDATTIVVAGEGGELNRVVVPGCLEPEAFSATGDALFVLDYRPPLAPDRYRVRLLHLATGELQPLLTRDKSVVPDGAEEEMRGLGRQAVYSSGQQYLFTLYTHQPEHEHTRELVAGARDDAPHVHAFVHTLSLGQNFAYCIDLPSPFGEGRPEGHAIALGRRGQHPIVVDTAGGAIARIDGVGLTVVQTAPFPTSADGQTYAAVAPNGEICYIGTASRVHVYRTRTLTPVMDFAVRGPVRGLAVSRDGSRLWVGQAGGVVALDASTGAEVARFPVGGLTAVRHAN